MKRIIYILAIAVSSSLVVTSCTEEEVAPTNTENDNSGGQGSGDPLTTRP